MTEPHAPPANSNHTTNIHSHRVSNRQLSRAAAQYLNRSSWQVRKQLSTTTHSIQRRRHSEASWWQVKRSTNYCKGISHRIWSILHRPKRNRYLRWLRIHTCRSNSIRRVKTAAWPQILLRMHLPNKRRLARLISSQSRALVKRIRLGKVRKFRHRTNKKNVHVKVKWIFNFPTPTHQEKLLSQSPRCKVLTRPRSLILFSSSSKVLRLSSASHSTRRTQTHPRF